MLNKFNKICDMILESSNTEDNVDNIKPTCCYCQSPVPMDVYERQKEWHETQMDGYFKRNNIPFDPKNCICKKCSDALSNMYSGGTKWTGD